MNKPIKKRLRSTTFALNEWGAIEKSPILLLQYWKIEYFDRVPIFFS